ncbi:MAG TPA: CPBP family intramembrane metalloprotease [Panacibacter sp.]|nr:CPBP family intramembrane metalloprotease [Panacibacter sp.]
MVQLTKTRSLLFHLYPGIIITFCFVLITPTLVARQYPPQLGLLLSIIIAAIPVLLSHLLVAKKKEQKVSILQLNGYTNKLPTGKLILYATGLVVFAFFIWGVTQPLDKFITDKLFSWLPAWYTVQDFNGYSKEAIQTTLIVNLLLNGALAPFVEEFYFRGYLLPRMQAWGKSAFIVNAVLFSLYHLWQPYVYVTLIISLMPMTYFVWKTKDLRLGILTHCLLNIVGAILSFGLLMKK